MAHAVEGYSRPNTGQTIQVKNQKKSTPASKPQTVKKNSSNVGGAVYTASRFEDVAKNKSTYTAKATYTNPVLAKKQSTIVQVAQSNKEAAKTSPTALSAAKNFFGGMVDAGVSTAVSLYNLGRHPVETAKGLYNAAAHPIQTAKAIKEIAVELGDDFKEGNADVKAHMIGRAVGEIGLAIAGAKAVDIGAKALKTFKAAQATAKSGKAGVVAEKLSEASKAADAVVDVTEKVGDKAAYVGQVASKVGNSGAASNGIKEGTKTNIKIDPFDEIGKLKTNVKYTSGEYEYLYETDNMGRLSKFETDNLQLTNRDNRLPHNPNTPGKLDDDHAGHLAGDRFGGSPELDNLVSQSANVNLSQYKKLENQWADAIKEGKQVKVTVEIKYDGDSLRPSKFNVQYEIDGKRYRQTILN